MTRPFARPFSELEKELSPRVIKAGKAKAKKMLREIELAELRQAAQKTQSKVARDLRISQAAVAKFEKRSDWHISTLTKYIASLGGKLHLVAEMPNGQNIELSSFTKS